MFMIILRSICVAIAALVVAVGLAIFVGIQVASYFLPKDSASSGGGEVGWDLVTIVHNYPVSSILLPVVVFAISFSLGFRHFSRSLAAPQ
jgi:hypothetical protein